MPEQYEPLLVARDDASVRSPTGGTLDLPAGTTLDGAAIQTGADADTTDWTPGGNDDVDTGTEVVDEVAVDETCMVVWYAWIAKTASRVMRSMQILAHMLKTDDGYGGYNYDVDYTVLGPPDLDENSTSAIPSTVFSVEYDETAGKLQLKATVDSDNWEARTQRMEVIASGS